MIARPSPGPALAEVWVSVAEREGAAVWLAGNELGVGAEATQAATAATQATMKARFWRGMVVPIMSHGPHT